MASVDNLFAVVTFFGLAIFFVVMGVAWNSFASLDDELWDQSSIGQNIKSNGQGAVDTFDVIFIIVYFGIHLGILVTAYLLRSHPVIYIAAIFLITILALLAAPLSNAYDDIAAETALSESADDLSMTHYIMTNLPRLEVIWGFLTAIVLFGFARAEGFF